MNYRVLFIVSFLILGIGVIGLLYTPSPITTVETQIISPATTAPKTNDKLIVVAQLSRDISAGTLLQAGDYVLNELNVAEDSPLINNDLKPILDSSDSRSLQGYLMAEAVKSGSFISPNIIISPQDPRFLVSSLDPKQEVAYRVYIEPTERYILDTVGSGGYVSVFSRQNALDNRNKTDLVKVADYLQVLQVNIIDPNEVTSELQTGSRRNYVGYVSLKANANHIKNFYSLDKEATLVVLPTDVKDENIDHRGTYIRNLRGQ